MVARVHRGLRGAVSQDRVCLEPEALPAVFEEDPIDTTRLAAVAHPLPAAQQEVPHSLERVERLRVLAVFVAGGEERVLETVLHEAPVRERPGQAVEVPRYDGRETILLKFGYLAEDQFSALNAGEFAHVVEVRVQVQEGEAGARAREFRPVCGADD